MKKKAIYLYVCWLISAFGALLSLWDLLAGKRLENPAEVMRLKGEVAQQYNRFYDVVFDLNHSMSQALILFVGLLLLAAVLVLLIKKNLLLANILYSVYSVFTILVMAYDYLSSQSLYHYFSDPAIRESIMMIPKAVTHSRTLTKYPLFSYCPLLYLASAEGLGSEKGTYLKFDK